MLKQFYDDLVAGIEARIAENPDAISPRKMFALEISRLGQRLYDPDIPVAWCGVSAPFDLLNALGVASSYVEFFGGVMANMGVADPSIAEAEQAGYAGDLCGYHRAVLGASRQGFLPPPDFMIATTCPCTNGLATMETLAKNFNKELFVLHVPQTNRQADVAYLAEQLKDMVAFVEGHISRKLAPENLSRAMELSNRASSILDQVYRLARAVPSPANGRLMSNLGVVVPLLFGLPAAVRVAETFRDDFTRKIESGQSGTDREKKRILWIQNRIQFKNNIIPTLEKQYGAAVIAEELNAITWDPLDIEAPYAGLARRTISISFNGPIEQRIRHLQQMARDFRIDAAINPCNWGCRQGTGSRGLLADGLKEVGVPVLNLEVDCVDSRNYAEGQLLTRIEAFMEMLEDRPSPWGEAVSAG